MDTLLKQYAELDAELKAIEAKKVVLKTEIMEGMKKNKLGKLESIYGNFTLASRLSWIYSSKIKQLEEKVKLAKTKEEQRGTAKVNATEYLIFKAL